MPIQPIFKDTAKVLSNQVTKLGQRKALNLVHTSIHPLQRKEVAIFQKFPAKEVATF